MASLEQFLQDLDDLDEDEVEGDQEAEEDDEIDDEDDIDMDADISEVKQASGLVSSKRMVDLMAKITEMMDSEANLDRWVGESDPEYEAIVQCNEMAIDIDNETEAIAKTIRDEYSKRFPELESLIMNPLDYARVVLKIGNETDLTQVDLTGILPSASIMVVTVTATTTVGVALPQDVLDRVLVRCEEVLQLNDNKTMLLNFVESRMSSLAPNLSTLVGTAIAAKLIGSAGGLNKLASLPSCVLQILGSKRKMLGGMGSTAANTAHAGFIFETDMIAQTPAHLKVRGCRLLSGKCTLAARVDTYNDKGGGNVGGQFKDEIQGKIEKWQEPPPVKNVKALPTPHARNTGTSKRAGKRVRKQKEKFAVTELRRQANRVEFAKEEETVGLDGKGIGMLGKLQHHGKVRLTAKEQKLLQQANKKQRAAPSSSNTSGLSSSLAFTPVQGIELVNPNIAKDSKEGTETYFSSTASFFKASMA